MVSSVGKPYQALEGLYPAEIWKYFGALSTIPRPSKHEQRVQAFLKDFAAQHGLSHKMDAAGNMVIFRPGTGGGEKAPTVIIQGHIDMVTEKNADTSHDFLKDAIRLVREGDWLKADGTTLGADNGLGVAAALAILASPADAKLPPVEALVTVEEEIGLRGASALDPSPLTGKAMLNLDTGEAGQSYIGCAGGGDSELALPVEREAASQGRSHLRITVSGLRGGPSGLNINDGRGNAIKLLARAVAAVLEQQPGARIVDVRGGDKRNALPREASAELLVPPDGAAAVQQLVAVQRDAFAVEFGQLESDLAVACTPSEGSAGAGAPLAQGSAERLLALLLGLPHGVVKMSHAVEGLVETSNNLASVAPTEGGAAYSIVQTTRSSISAALQSQRDVIRRLGRLAGASATQGPAYPGWIPNPSSSIVQLAKEVFTEVNGKEPELKAIHAGLECGIIGERSPGLDMVSYGPTILGAHSPDERVQISTVPAFWEATKRILERLADKTT